jgi:hypothetical protein
MGQLLNSGAALVSTLKKAGGLLGPDEGRRPCEHEPTSVEPLLQPFEI